MSVEIVLPSLIAAVGGSAIVVGMFTKIVVQLTAAYIEKSNEEADQLDLSVGGQDFTINLNSIGNGEKHKIEEALEAVKKLQHV